MDAFSDQKFQTLICERVCRRQKKQGKPNNTELFKAKRKAASSDVPGFKTTIIKSSEIFLYSFSTIKIAIIIII